MARHSDERFARLLADLQSKGGNGKPASRRAAAEPKREELTLVAGDGERKPLSGGLAAKVSEKGAVSVYGLGRFPVTLYANQWERVLAAADEIRQFIKKNDRKLSKR